MPLHKRGRCLEAIAAAVNEGYQAKVTPMRRRFFVKHKRIVWVALGLLLVSTTLSVALWPRQREARGDGYRGVIFERHRAEIVLGAMIRNDSETFWTPSRADIRALERVLAAHVARERPDLAPSLATYRRQYYGLTRRGERRIYVVGFCATDTFDWRRRFASIAETGACHLEAEYDMATGRLTLFWVNE